MKVAIHRVSLASLAKFGCLLGGAAAFVPSLLCGLAGLGLSSLLRRWLESWQVMSISVLGQEIARFDLVHLLGLSSLLDLLRSLTGVSLPVLFLAVLTLATAGGLLLAATVVLVGMVYNVLAFATGGLVVEMSSASRKPSAE